MSILRNSSQAPIIRHVVYKAFAGPKISGTVPFSVTENSHWQRILRVAAYVETGGAFGAVNAYDGCGCSAGLVQNILVYPKELADEDFHAENDQGSLGSLIYAMPDCPEKEALLWALAAEDWEFKQDGKFYYIKDKTVKLGLKTINAKKGAAVYGADLRNTFTPIAGKVPAIGDNWSRACYWITLVHNLFKNPVTFAKQAELGIEHLQSYATRLKAAGQPIKGLIYQDNLDKQLSPELDMAMTLFFSHAVNSPATAQKCLVSAVSLAGGKGEAALAKSIVNIMRASTFGRWNSLDAGGRYQRTRNAMLELNMKLKCWDSSLFTTIMPVK
jgi:hypothetical protein